MVHLGKMWGLDENIARLRADQENGCGPQVRGQVFEPAGLNMDQRLPLEAPGVTILAPANKMIFHTPSSPE
jgi:hypothetical protein